MKLFANIWSPRKICVIIMRINGGALSFDAMLVGKSQQSVGRFESVQELVKKVGTSKAYHLHVYGSGVLSRLAASIPSYKEQLVVGGNSNDFYFTTYDDGKNVATSFFRKNVTEPVVDTFNQNKWHLLGITSGDVPLCTVDENGNFKSQMLVELDEGKINVFERNQVDNSERIEDTLSYAILRNYQAQHELYDWNRFSENLENFKQFSQFKTIGLVFLLGLLGALMVNYLYQNHLNNEIAQLEIDLSAGNENLSLLNRLESEKERKEQLIASAGVFSPRFLSFYLDEIGRTVPEDIDLQNLTLFPLENKLKNKQKVTVNTDKMLIEGTTPHNVTLDDWIEQMERFEWVHSVELLNYIKKTEKSAEFKLLITLTQ